MRCPPLAVAAVLLSLGAWQTAGAAWIHAKAWLAYGLIEHAWERSLDGAAAPRPWPDADFTPIARLRTPAQDVDQLVLSNASARTLAFGPGLLIENAVADHSGHIVVAGHRDTHFPWVSHLAHGDRIDLQDSAGNWRSYVVVDRAVIDRDAWSGLEIDASPALTLLTCHAQSSLGPTTGWLLVRAVPVADSPPAF
jgi:sortase A